MPPYHQTKQRNFFILFSFSFHYLFPRTKQECYIYSIRIYSISSHVFLNMILLRRKLPAKFQTPFSSRPKRRKNDVAPHHSLSLSLSLSLLKTMTPTPQPQNLSITTTLRPFSPLQICMHPHSITHTTIPSYLVLRVIIHIKAASIL